MNGESTPLRCMAAIRKLAPFVERLSATEGKIIINHRQIGGLGYLHAFQFEKGMALLEESMMAAGGQSGSDTAASQKVLSFIKHMDRYVEFLRTKESISDQMDQMLAEFYMAYGEVRKLLGY